MTIRWKLLTVISAIVLSAGGLAVLVTLDALAVRTLLESATAELGLTQRAVEDGNAVEARRAVDSASELVDAAKGRTDGPGWWLAGRVPRWGASARAGTGAVALADATVELASAAVDEAITLVGEGPSTFVGPGGRIDTSALGAAATTLEGLALEPLQEQRDRLESLPASGLVGPIRAGRDEAVARADEVLETLGRARIGARVFSGFLGAEGPRSYLLAVQNPAELRGTGGLFSYVAEVTANEGSIDLQPAGRGIDLSDRITTGSQDTFGFSLTPVDRPDDFAARYDSNGGGAIIQSVNLDPDLPTVAPVLLELYRVRTDRVVDGVIVVDPFALAAIVDATGGPIQLPRDVRNAAPGLPARLTARNIPRTLLIDVYDVFAGDNAARAAFDETVTLAALERLTSGNWSPARLARSLADAGGDRRLQLFSTDETEQAGLVELGLSGALPREDTTGDLLAVTGVNAGPDKSDAHVGHRVIAHIDLRSQAGGTPSQVIRSANVEVEVTNPLRPGDHDGYITGTNTPAPVGSSGSRRTIDALNRTWFTVWSPAGTRITNVRDGVQGGVLRTGSIHDHTAIDYFLETPSASTASFSAGYAGPMELRQVGGRTLYELTLWRQPKAIPDHWEVSVAPPAGYRVAEITFDGGGRAGTGLGTGQPLQLTSEVVDGVARLHGSATRDVVLQLWMERA